MTRPRALVPRALVPRRPVPRTLATPALVALALVVTLAVVGCSKGATKDTGTGPAPARVEAIGGGRSQVRLTAEAAKRLDIQIAPVRTEGVPAARLAPGQDEGAQRTVLPFAAVLYAPDGAAFVYVNPEPLVFRREPIAIDYVDADKAVVSKGPQPGATVVVVGGTELFGTESGIGDE